MWRNSLQRPQTQGQRVNMAAPLSIVIPAFNQVDYCRQCVASIRQNTERPYQLVLVDNASTDGVAEYFDSQADAVVIHAETNLGFAGGVNLGIARAEGHVLLLNSDTLVPRGWLGRLEAALEQSEDIGIVGPMSNYVSGTQQIDGLSFGSLEEINTYADSLAQEKPGSLRDVARLVGFCMLIRDRVVRDVGTFDEAYGIGNFEDDDYCLRTLRAGYRLCVAEDSFVFHYGNRTFAGMGIVDGEWKGLIEENQALFERKWAAAPHERSDALQQSRQLNRAAQDAMAQGNTPEALRLLGKAVEVAPGHEVNHNDLGAVLWGMGEFERAEECFRRALRINPGYAEAKDNLLQAAAAQGTLDAAKHFLEGLTGKETTS